jgi:arylsulfatase A-like enzyme
MDLYATLVAAAGAVDGPGRRPIDGRDLRAHLAGTAPSPTRELIYVNVNRVEAVREGAWKLRAAPGQPPQLFDLELDPSERYDRAASEPEVAARLLARLRAADDKTP